MPALPTLTALTAWFRYLLLATLLLGATHAMCAAPTTAPATASSTLVRPAAQAFGSSFAGPRSNYRITRTANGFAVKDINTSSSVDLVAPTSLQFADVTVNLQIADLSKAISPDKLQTLIELYVAFFNRVPEADGLAYWMGQYNAGLSLNQIADSFYAAALQYASLTGYTSSMSHADFVRIIYRNVLGRSGSTAPPDADVQYWANKLADGSSTKGSLLTTMLGSAHTFASDGTWSWVSQLLDNKVTVAKIFAIEQGLGYITPSLSITQGMAIAAAVTPSSIDAAYNLIGIADTSFNLLDPYRPEPKLQAISPMAVMVNTPTLFTVSGQDLPATVVMILGRSPCQTHPGSNTSTGFKAICTATTAGSETAMVRRDGTLADGGLLIDKVSIRTCAAHLILVNGACVTSSLLLPLMKDSYGNEIPEADFGGGDPDAAGADGVASDGAPIKNALVTLVDKLGKVVTATTNAAGYYRVSIKGMTPPFVASAIGLNNTAYLATHPGPIKRREFITFNENKLTDAETSNVLLEVSNNTGSGLAQRALAVNAIKANGVSAVASVIARLTPSELEILLKAAKSRLIDQLRTQLTQLGLDAATFDPVTTPFKAELTDPYDKLLETTTVTKDPGTGQTTVLLRYTLGGSVSGLTGSGLVLASNGQTVAVPAGAGSFTLPTALVQGTAYGVSVQTQPSGQNCTVSNGSGTMPAANVGSVAVSCTTPTSNTLLSETWESGSIDSSVWTTYGSPASTVVPAIGGRSGYVFDNNGDPNYDSGVFSVQPISLSAGASIEADVYLDFSNVAGCWAGVSFALSESDTPVASSINPNWGGFYWSLSAHGDACWASPDNLKRRSWFSFGVMPTSGTWESSNDVINADAYAGGWHKARMDILADGRASFLIDGSVLWTSTQAIDIRYLTGKRLLLGSRSSGSAGKAYHDNITVSAASSRYSTIGSFPITDCVKDNTTGLTWEGKPTSGLRASSDEYTSYNSTTALQNCTGATCVAPTQSQIDASTNSIGYKNAVNASSLCGYADWRLPTLTELQGLALSGVGSPTIDTTWFPNTQGRGYWTSTPSPSQAGLAWSVNFNDGGTGYYNSGYNRDFLRLVRDQSIVTNGLVAYYPFDGNANDASGNGNHGIDNGGVSYISGAKGLAANFDGVNDYISIPHHSIFNLGTSFTLSVWVNISSGAYDAIRIIDKATGGTCNGWNFDTHDSSQPGFRMRMDSSCPWINSQSAFSADSWHHLLVTVDNLQATFYLDGMVDGSGRISTPPSNTLDLYIGSAHPSTNDSMFKGQLDEIRMYNRALTPTEIQQLYAQR